MGKTEKHLQSLIDDLPRRFLRKALKEKLRDAGVTDKAAIDAFANHVLDGNETNFTWDDGDEGPEKNFKITFTDEDTDEIIMKLDSFMKDDLPEVINKSIQHTAKSISKRLRKQWPDVKLDLRHQQDHFRDRIDLRWSKGIDPLRMMLWIARKVGEEFGDRLSRSKAKKNIITRNAILALHVRACQTTLEILTLIENGLSDGAYARWRTLYEINVVAFVIDKYGDDVAARYIDHDCVAIRENMVNDFRFHEVEFDPLSLEGEAKEIEADYQSAILEYGKPFASPYGWAADMLDKKKPTFQDLERSVDWGALPPEFKLSSYKIHAGAAGTYRSLCLIGDSKFLHAGATNAGLDTPAIMTAQSLLQITTLVFKKPYDLEVTAQMQSMLLLREKVIKHCNRIAEQLEADELGMQEME